MTATQPDLDALVRNAAASALRNFPHGTVSAGRVREAFIAIMSAVLTAHNAARAPGRADAEAMFRASAADDARRLAEIREWLVTPGTITARAPRGADDREADVEMLLRLLDATAGAREAMFRAGAEATREPILAVMRSHLASERATLLEFKEALPAVIALKECLVEADALPLPTPPQRTNERSE